MRLQFRDRTRSDLVAVSHISNKLEYRLVVACWCVLVVSHTKRSHRPTEIEIGFASVHLSSFDTHIPNVCYCTAWPRPYILRKHFTTRLYFSPSIKFSFAFESICVSRLFHVFSFLPSFFRCCCCLVWFGSLVRTISL